MEENFTNSEFEEFLQDQVKNHRMYPSDSVWSDINKKLHGDKKWPALTMAAFALLIATITICVYFTPKPNIFASNPANSSLNHNDGLRSTNVINNLTSSPRFSKQNATSLQLIKAQSTSITTTIASTNQPSIATTNFNSKQKSENSLLSGTRITNTDNSKNKLTSTDPESVYKTFKNDNKKIESVETLGASHPEKLSNLATQSIVEKLQFAKDYNDKNMVDNFLKDHKEDLPLYTTPKTKSDRHKFSFQIYAAPSISYRNLIEDKSILKENTSGPVGINNVTDVNNIVRHKPGVGLEVGASVHYNLSNTFRVKTGLQFNVRQYSIEAYRSNIELASIALIESNRIDTINTLATYRTNNGYYSDELVNKYYQLSVPLGVEWEIIGNKRIQFNVAGSIQPTYLLNRNAYLLSANFKNYTENADIIRRWNINSNVEAFVSFKAGDFKWQLGPQLRYQPYSTFIRQYPIKEHLMDYGFKIGISKTFN